MSFLTEFPPQKRLNNLKGARKWIPLNAEVRKMCHLCLISQDSVGDDNSRETPHDTRRFTLWLHQTVNVNTPEKILIIMYHFALLYPHTVYHTAKQSK